MSGEKTPSRNVNPKELDKLSNVHVERTLNRGESICFRKSPHVERAFRSEVLFNLIKS